MRPGNLKEINFIGCDSWIPKRRRWLLILLVISLIGLSAFLRVYHIGTQEIWIDEANAIVVSDSALPKIAARLKHDLNPPLFPFLLHFWMKF